jgi:predicted regulator of Ras-like GTPase activity (Roadblock/LC7/MglB family)
VNTTALHTALNSLFDLGGVHGSFLIAPSGDVVARALPAVIDDGTLTEVGGRVLRLGETMQSVGLDLDLSVLRFREHKLYVKSIAGGALCILTTPHVNLPALRMAANLVARRAESATASAPSRQRRERVHADGDGVPSPRDLAAEAASELSPYDTGAPYAAVPAPRTTGVSRAFATPSPAPPAPPFPPGPVHEHAGHLVAARQSTSHPVVARRSSTGFKLPTPIPGEPFPEPPSAAFAEEQEDYDAGAGGTSGPAAVVADSARPGEGVRMYRGRRIE